MIKLKISPLDPSQLSEPSGMSECVIAKCHAFNQLALIKAALKDMRKRQRLWNKRHDLCLRAIGKAAKGAADESQR